MENELVLSPVHPRSKLRGILRQNKQQGVAVVALLILVLLIGGLVVSLNLINIQQIFKSRASLANASLSLPASKTVSPNQEFEVPVMLSTGGEEIVAADIVINFDKSSLQLLDIIEKPSSNNKLTTLTPRNGSFNKNKVITTANSTGTIDFGAICFTVAGCPEGQKQDLGETNPLIGLKFKALKAATTQVSILYSPTLTTNSNLVNRSGQNVLGKVISLSLNIIQTQDNLAAGDRPTTGNTAPEEVRPSPTLLQRIDTTVQVEPTSDPALLQRIIEPELVNPSFESWSSGAGSGTVDRKAPDGWTLTPNDGYSFKGQGKSGSGWQRTAFGNGGEYVGGYQEVTVSPNTNYIISGWVWAPGALSWYRSDAGGKIDVRNRVCAKTTSNQNINCTESTEGSGNWQKIEVSFNSGSNNDVRVYFGTNISQTTFWDDFSISLQ